VTAMKTILIVDDHTLFRRGLMAILAAERQVKVVDEASDGEEALRKMQEIQPDVVLMDVRMPACNGLEATRLIREKGFTGGILMLTVSDREDDLFAAIKAGANGYLLKSAEPEELVSAINHVAQGEAVISPSMATRLLSEFSSISGKRSQRPTESEADLSGREIEILKLVADGAGNREVASALFITENTVKTHMRHIMEKLHIKNRSQAVAYAVRSELLRSGVADKDEP